MKRLRQIVAISMVTAALAFVPSVSARTTRDYSDLSEKLATKYNLKADDVGRFIEKYYADKNKDEDTSTMFADHLAFIENKLNAGVKNGEITKEQKKAVMAKLKKMMDKGPSAQEYRKMSDGELKEHIKAWKKEMTAWAKKHDMTMAQLREMVGKGNKYFMGVELDK